MSFIIIYTLLKGKKMKTVEATCGTERMIKCRIITDEDWYTLSIDDLAFVKNQPIFGLTFYEEKALKNTLKKVKDKEIVKQIKEQFHL